MTKIFSRFGLVVLIWAFFAQTALAGFGVSPPGFKEERLVRGAELERVVYLVQGDPKDPAQIDIEIDESPIKAWISVKPGMSFVIPKDIQQFPLTINIKVPEDAEFGIYKGYVRARLAPQSSETEEGRQVTSGVGIALAVRIDLELTVGEGLFYEFKLRNIDLRDVTEIDNPTAVITVENLGNVPAGPQEANFELLNSYGDVRLAYVQGVKIERVPAFQTEDVFIEFPLSVRLGPGSYWGVMRLYDNDKQIREHRDTFNVRKANFFDRYGLYLLIGAGLVTVIVILLIIIFRLKRRPA